jgi:hypothetical protein
MLIKKTIFAICLAFTLCVPILNSSSITAVAASNPCGDIDGMDGETRKALGCDDTVITEKDIVQRVLTFMYWVVGIAAVIMIIVSGIMYTTSGGDPARVKKAKDALTVAVIGLIVALLAAMIINWVTGVLLS